MSQPPVTDPPVTDPPADGAPSGPAREALKAIIGEVFDEKKAAWDAETPSRTGRRKNFLESILGM